MAVTTARQTVETALALLSSLPGESIQTLVQHLHDHLDALLAPLAWLEQTLAPYRQNLDPATETLILWAWRHRQALALTPGEGFPAHLQATVQAFWLALSFFHRSSSLAESLHSWLRPYLTLHRGTPHGSCRCCNWSGTIIRSPAEAAGNTPLQLAGVSDAPTLAEALNQLSTVQPAAARQPTIHYTLAEIFGLSLEEQASLPLA